MLYTLLEAENVVELSLSITKRLMLYTRPALCISMHTANEKLILTLNPNSNITRNLIPNIYISVSTWPITVIQLLLKKWPLMRGAGHGAGSPFPVFAIPKVRCSQG